METSIICDNMGHFCLNVACRLSLCNCHPCLFYPCLHLITLYNILAVVDDIVCVGEEFYVYDAEDCVKWFALLSVKECVSRLYEMGEISQCLKVSNLSQSK